MISDKKEVCYCGSCKDDTSHVVVLVRKQSPYKGSKNQTTKEFWAGVVKGWFLGAFIASMDEFERHKVCEACGEKTIEI